VTFLAFLVSLAVAPSGWAPVRWPSADPASLELLDGTPFNCLLLERDAWQAGVVKSAGSRGRAALGVVRPADGPRETIERAHGAGLDGLVLEGDFESAAAAYFRGHYHGVLIELPSRSRLEPGSKAAVVGTTQGVWPGILVQQGGAVKAAPTGAPWVETNTGFLRFVRSLTAAPVWIANLPPPRQVLKVERYLQAVADAAAASARWVVALDDDFARRLLDRESAALADWGRIAAHVRYFEEHPEWRGLRPAGSLALIQGASSGALYSGGILDMIAARNIPVRIFPPSGIGEETVAGVKMAVNVDPAAVAEDQKEALRSLTRAGGTLLNGPPGWKMPAITAENITLGQQDVDTLAAIWRDVNAMIGRANLGVRLFNVAGMLSNFVAGAGGRPAVLHLVNYTGYPVENVAVQAAGAFRQARLYAPEQPAKDLKVHVGDEASEIEIDKVATVVTLVLE
jgi:hypothetical protein